MMRRVFVLLFKTIVLASMVLHMVALGAMTSFAQSSGGVTPQLEAPPHLARTVGDCVDVAQAYARSFTSSPRPPIEAEKSCEGGRIRMYAASERHFGHRIMDPAQFSVVLLVDAGVTLDFSSLARGVISFNGQEFELVSANALSHEQQPVSVQASTMPDGHTLVRIDLISQSSVPPSHAPYLVFRLDLRYAVGNILDAEGRDTGSADWRVLSSPLIAVTMSPTAGVVGQPTMTIPEIAPHKLPWPTISLLVVGVFLLLLAPGLAVVRWINRIRPGRKVPSNEVAWKILRPLFERGRDEGFSPASLRLVSHAVRQYLQVRSATLNELRPLLSAHSKRESIFRVLALCDAVLYEGHTLSHHEANQLVMDVEAIIPRPS